MPSWKLTYLLVITCTIVEKSTTAPWERPMATPLMYNVVPHGSYGVIICPSTVPLVLGCRSCLWACFSAHSSSFSLICLASSFLTSVLLLATSYLNPATIFSRVVTGPNISATDVFNRGPSLLGRTPSPIGTFPRAL